MRVGVRALRHRRDRCDRAPARPHRTPTTVRAVAEASIEAAGKNALYRVLTNPYYAGVIRYKGALHPGAHEPIVEPALFDQVQSLTSCTRRAVPVQVAERLVGDSYASITISEADYRHTSLPRSMRRV